MKKKKNHFHLLPLFTPKDFTWTLFPIDFKALVYHGAKPLFCVIPSFSLTYKLHSCVLMYYVFHTHYQVDFDQRFSFWIHGITYDHIPLALNHTSEWRIALGVIFKLDTIQHLRDENLELQKVRLHFKTNPLELDIINFFQILVPWWYCCWLISHLVMNWKLFAKIFAKIFMRQKTPWSLRGLWFLMLDIIISCMIWFVNFLLIARRII
jgi:hypothetical protein